MKIVTTFIAVIILTTILSNCSKSISENIHSVNKELPLCNTPVNNYLKLKMPTDFTNLKIDSTIKYNLGGRKVLYKIPYKDKPSHLEFVTVFVDSTINQLSHTLIKIIPLNDYSKDTLFTGKIITYRTNKIDTLSILNGMYQPNSSFLNPDAPVETPGTNLPTVIVSAGSGSSPGWPSPAQIFVHIVTMTGGLYNGGGAMGGYVPTAEGSGGGGSGSGGGGGASTAPSCYSPEETNTQEFASIAEDYNAFENDTSINLAKYLECFNSISNNGATYEVKLCVDLPWNNLPSVGLNIFNSHQVGHTFLQLTKRNGSQFITQSLGFYPTGMLNVFTGISGGAFKNDATILKKHEYNASMTINASANQFNAIINYLAYANTQNYNLFNYNCTTIGINAVNEIINPDIYVIPKRIALLSPTSPPISGIFMQCPGNLYEYIKVAVPSSAISYEYGVVKYANRSNGPCN